MTPSTSIIIPTYREAENLPLIIPRISAACKDAGLIFEIIVVDDNSQDGTESVCDQLSEENGVSLTTRKNERGLSSAVIRGFEQAKNDLMVVIDADLSHPPEAIPGLVSSLGPDVDMVIGSRYVEGGGIEQGWGFFRWLNSKVATLLAWPLTKTTDPMAGFFCIRRERFSQALELNPIGYKIGLELIVKCKCKNIVDYPIYFHDRAHGESKLSLKEQLNYLKHIKRLYDHKFGLTSKFLQFGLVGTTGLVVDLTVFNLLLLFLPVSVARALAIVTAMTWNFALNHRITFSRANQKPLLLLYLQFCASCAIGGTVNWFVSVQLIYFSSSFFGIPSIAAVAGALSGMTVNFLLCSTWVFARQNRTRQTRAGDQVTLDESAHHSSS